MSSLYVTRPGAELSKKGGRVAVRWQRQTLAEMPFRDIERIVLVGPASLSPALVPILLRARIPVHFCSTHGRYYGNLSNAAQDVEFWLRQVDCSRNETLRLEVARKLVTCKVRHQQHLLQRHARNHSDRVLQEVATQISALPARLERQRSVAEMMGVEGHASALFFSVFGRCLRANGVSFSGRNRRPPRDPVNSLLSLGYMLVLGEVISILTVHGFHPGLGFLHEVSQRRPALALDILELARQPIVDRLTLTLFNRQVLATEDFQSDQSGAVRLREAALRRYLAFYERSMSTTFRFRRNSRPGSFRDWVSEQVDSLKAALQEGKSWQPEALEL